MKASLIKMDLADREIASLVNIEASGIKMAKYRLKKKLQLSVEGDIQILYSIHQLEY